jgi:hypothetical protein
MDPSTNYVDPLFQGSMAKGPPTLSVYVFVSVSVSNSVYVFISVRVEVSHWVIGSFEE